MCRGTGAVPVAATDSGEAQTVPRLTKRALVISREACSDSVKKHRANRVAFEKRYGRFTDRAYQWRRQGLMVGEAHLVGEANILT